MKGMTGEKLQRLAAQAMLDLSPEEREKMALALEPLLALLDGAQSGEESGAPGSLEQGPRNPGEPPLPYQGRPDAVAESLPLALVLANAPKAQGALIQLPRVLE